MLCIGLVQIAGYYLAGMLASNDGNMAVPQPDTLLYCQAARRIVEGHPFSFSAGTAASTGTTSVLYPFILAIPYALGTTGDALLMSGFWLNALFYLVFLLGWGKALCNWLESPWARLTGAILLALAGQPAFCAMAQSDIGCWMAISALFAWGLAANKPLLYGPILIIAPWIRPEGMICIIAFGMVFLVGKCLQRGKKPLLDPNMAWGILVLSIISMIAVFALNYALTGHLQFSSVANKGYFKTIPFAAAVSRTTNDFLSIVNSYLLGLATSVPRNVVLPAILSAVFIWLGLLVHPWHRPSSFNLCIFLLAALGGILTVSQSGWQGSNFDRYLAWVYPIYVLFLAEGLITFVNRHSRSLPGFFIPLAACLLFFAGTAFVSMCHFKQGASISDKLRIFASEINNLLPRSSSVASFGACGIAYKLGDRTYKHLSGIYSPEFFTKTTASAFEIIKNVDDVRFSYWILSPELSTTIPSAYRVSCYGESILTGPDGYEVRQADWSAFDHARVPNVKIPQNKHLVCRVDVGHEADEHAADYEMINRYGQTESDDPFVVIDDLAGKPAIDAARLLVGGDAMTLPLQPDKDVLVVMRTYPKHTLSHRNSAGSFSTEYTFANPLKLNVSIDNEALAPVSVTYATNGFSDVVFTLPGAAIKKSPSRLALLGDHIAAGYWFYQ
jgi:hypothetical protein